MLDRLEAAEAHLAALEVHQRAQFANLHARADVLRGALVLQSDRQSDLAASLAQLRAARRREPCSLCVRGDGCDSCDALHG